MLVNSNFSSPNFSTRSKDIEYIILHFTEMTFKGALERLCDVSSQVSAHYLIKDNGAIYQLVQDKNIAWHAGQSMWHKQDKLNQNSIGIELDNLGDRPFSQLQMTSCIKLCLYLVKKHNIPARNLLGHSDIAPDRKIDPGIFFDWSLLSKYGLGLWHGLKANLHNTILYQFNSKGQNIATLQLQLKQLGYNIKITNHFDQQTNFVIRAFQSKFAPDLIHSLGIGYYKEPNSKYHWDMHSQHILYALLDK